MCFQNCIFYYSVIFYANFNLLFVLYLPKLFKTRPVQTCFKIAVRVYATELERQRKHGTNKSRTNISPTIKKRQITLHQHGRGSKMDKPLLGKERTTPGAKPKTLCEQKNLGQSETSGGQHLDVQIKVRTTTHTQGQVRRRRQENNKYKGNTSHTKQNIKTPGWKQNQRQKKHGGNVG